MVRTETELEPLLAPESVAVVGASPDSWYSSQLVDNLLDYGFDGDVYLVNPGRDEAWGRTCYDAVSDLPEPVDLAVVSVPREVVVDVVREAGEMGVPAALVITAGFAEADDEGAALEAELAEVADAHDVAVCGPNCIGLANAREGTVLTSTCSRRPEPGSIGLVSQSGALAFTTFFERAADEDVHFSHVVSTGNEADLSVTDYVGSLADREAVDAVCTYVEGVDDPRRFMAAADEAVRSGTPVLTVKVGASDVAEAASVSHTGSVTGNDAAWDAAFAQTGVERVPDVPDLLSRASAHAAFDPPASDRVCVASTSGGLASLLADMAADRGLSLPAIEGETERALLDSEDLLTFGEMHNPADIRGYGAEVLPDIADVLFADDAFDAYVFAIGLPAVGEDAEEIADDLLAVADAASDPVLFLWTGRKEPEDADSAAAGASGDATPVQPYERVRRETPLFYDPSRCMDALASLVDAGERRDRLAARPSRTELAADTTASSPDDDLPDDDVLTWADAEELLAEYGVDLHETRLATDPEEAVAAAEAVGFPVVLKVDSPDVPHRTDAGAVRTDLSDAEAVREAYREVVANTEAFAPDARIEGVLVQPHAEAGVEALVGASRDPVFGPLVTVGSGGTAVESLADATVRVPPFSEADARDAIDETRLADLLASDRGDGGEQAGSGGDVAALASLLERVGDLCTEIETVAELDLNPVVVHDEGVSVVDALVRTE